MTLRKFHLLQLEYLAEKKEDRRVLEGCVYKLMCSWLTKAPEFEEVFPPPEKRLADPPGEPLIPSEECEATEEDATVYQQIVSGLDQIPEDLEYGRP